MGYEVTFYFKQKNKETGEYAPEQESFKKRVGDPYEDTPVETLASLVLRQLARRDIFVEDVEIFEITKKKISFKESKNGITIKNKKFGLDDTFEITAEQDQPEEIIQNTNTNEVDKPIKEVLSTSKLRPIKKMLFAPEPQQQIKLLKQGIKLTPNKTYDIFKIEKHINGITEIYLLVDDNGKDKLVADDYFVPPTKLDEAPDDFGLSDDGLNWGGVINDSIPSLRKWLWQVKNKKKEKSRKEKK